MTTTTSASVPKTALPIPASPAASVGNWSALAVLMAGIFVIILDFFIVNVALPSMQADLHASASAIEWVVAGYSLTFATFLITAARIGDRIGRRRTFMLGIGLFTLASAACGAAPNTAVLVSARLLQGLAAALISPNVLAIIGVVYRGPARIRALTVYGLVVGLAGLSAQIIGGVLVSANVADLGWRAVFLINVPFGIAAVFLAPRRVPESRSEGETRFDVVGTVLVASGVATLLIPLVEGRQQGWPVWTWLTLCAAPLILVGFATYQVWLSRRGGAPLLDPSMFRDRSLSAGLITQLMFSGGQASFFVVLALFLQQGRGLSPLEAGLMFTVMAAAYLLTSLRVPQLTARHGRTLIALGALTAACGDGLLLAAVAAMGATGSVLVLAPGLVLVGVGMGLGITPLVSIILGGIDPRRAGAASGALASVQQLGNSLGVAATGLIFFSTLAGGYAQAFAVSLVQLAGLMVVVALLTRLLPAYTPRPADHAN